MWFHEFFHNRFQQICMISVSCDCMRCISETCQNVAAMFINNQFHEFFNLIFGSFCHLKPLAAGSGQLCSPSSWLQQKIQFVQAASFAQLSLKKTCWMKCLCERGSAHVERARAWAQRRACSSKTKLSCSAWCSTLHNGDFFVKLSNQRELSFKYSEATNKSVTFLILFWDIFLLT